MYENNQKKVDRRIPKEGNEDQKQSVISSMQSESTKSQLEKLANKHYVSLNNLDSNF